MSAVLEEHIGYLKLPHRAALYRDAISAVVRPGDVVADLGCGLGVLGIECLKAGAAHVYGIDRSDAIELARETVARAGLADRYTCIRGSSFRVELPQQVDVLICDHVGYFGFDYGIIAMLVDARKRLLKPGGTVIPGDLGLVVAAVGSTRARAEVESWTTDPVPGEVGWLQNYAVNAKHALVFDADELCSRGSELGRIDLAQCEAGGFAFSTRIVIDRDCQLDGLAGWFDTALAPGVHMTNSPLDPQSIGRDQAFLPLARPVSVAAGDTVAVSLRADPVNDLITWTVTPPGGAAQTMSTWKSRVLTPQDLVTGQDLPLALNAVGRARQVVLGFVDGKRTASEIEAAVLAAHPDLFPSKAEISRFVRRELGLSAT